jgi:hypothetical protein
LQEYQSLRGKEDEAFQRGCAQQAFENISETSAQRGKGFRLTEFGVTFDELLEQYFNVYGVSKKEKEYATALCMVNTEFLEEWDRLRKFKKSADAAMKRGIEAALRRSRSLFAIPLQVRRALEENGYELLNPEALRSTIPTILREGLTLEVNKDGLECEVVFMPDGKVFTHVEAGTRSACQRASQKLREEVGNVIRQVGLVTGTPIRLSAEASGFGDGTSSLSSTAQAPQRAPGCSAPVPAKLTR